MGTVYLRGKTWWIKYSQNGKAYYESSESKKKTVANELLKQREGEIVDGKTPTGAFKKTTFTDLKDEFIDDYKINQKKSLERAEISAKHLEKFFSGYRANQITTAAIKKYIQGRIEDGVANGTVNRELRALGRMLSIGYNDGRVGRIPHIPTLQENNVRKGFFEHGEYIALRDAMPEHLKGFVTFGYRTGWRHSEIAGLTWNLVDLDDNIVRLETGETKNDEGRTVYLDGELKEVLTAQWESRKKGKKVLPYVFRNADGSDRVKRFDKSWKTACKTAGIGPRLFHDFRRTAVRNMVRAGIPERVAMMVSGHKTRSVFDRYNIVSDTDLRLAAQKQETYLDSQTVTKTVTIHHLDEKKPAVENP